MIDRPQVGDFIIFDAFPKLHALYALRWNQSSLLRCTKLTASLVNFYLLSLFVYNLNNFDEPMNFLWETLIVSVPQTLWRMSTLSWKGRVRKMCDPLASEHCFGECLTQIERHHHNRNQLELDSVIRTVMLFLMCNKGSILLLRGKGDGWPLSSKSAQTVYFQLFMLALLNDVFGEKTNEWLHGPMRQKKIENYSTFFGYIQDKYHIIFFWWQMFVGRKQKNAPFNTEGKSDRIKHWQ